MNSKRLHIILLAVIALLCIGLIAGAYGINKVLTAEARTLVSLKAKRQALDQEEISLKAAKRDIQKYAELEKITHTIVPEDKSQAEAVREIVNIAEANGIILGSITFPASTLGAGFKPTAGATTPAPAAAAGPGGGKLSQLTPVPNIPGVYLLPITVSSDSNQPVLYTRLINFLDDLEHNRRTAQVSSITLQPDSKNPNLLTFTLIINGYIKP